MLRMPGMSRDVRSREAARLHVLLLLLMQEKRRIMCAGGWLATTATAALLHALPEARARGKGRRLLLCRCS